jgi:hypothetical protein
MAWFKVWLATVLGGKPIAFLGEASSGERGRGIYVWVEFSLRALFTTHLISFRLLLPACADRRCDFGGLLINNRTRDA